MTKPGTSCQRRNGEKKQQKKDSHLSFRVRENHRLTASNSCDTKIKFASGFLKENSQHVVFKHCLIPLKFRVYKTHQDKHSQDRISQTLLENGTKTENF